MENLYKSDEYIRKNPTLHAEASAWKVSKILPFIDFLVDKELRKNKLKLLDVGGGAGLILRGVAGHIEDRGIDVKKYALDLSPRMLEVQRRNNPDLLKVLNEDIRHTSLADKEVDIALLIDVLEHVPEPQIALRELRRISKYAIFKIPLESNLASKISNFLDRGKLRRHFIQDCGHINVYGLSAVLKQIETYLGHIFMVNFTNVFDYSLGQNKLNWIGRIEAILGLAMSKVYPKLASLVFGDFIVLLVKCY